MKRRFFACIIFACAAALSASAEEIAFKYRQTKPGDTQLKTQDFLSNMKMTVKSGGNVVNTVEQGSTKSEKRKVAVIESSGDTMTKIKMTYLSSTMSGPGQPEAKATPYSGKTYVAEMKNKEVSVLGDDGKALEDAEEAAFIAKDAKSIMTPERFSKLFDGKVLKPGDKVEITDEVAREMMGADDGRPVKVEKMDVVLKEIKKATSGTQGIFSVDMLISSDLNPAMKMSVAMKGDMTIAADTCWPVSMLLSGPLTLKGSQQKGDAKIDFDGAGEMKINMSAEYGK